MGWVVGVDVGGTFTDFFAFDECGAVRVHKRPSTPANPADAIIEGLIELCRDAGIEPASVGRLCHGTTVATNALIQRRGGKVALITTKGFRDLLEIGRQTRPLMYDLQTDHPPALVPRERRFEVDERVVADGKVLRPLAPSSLEAVLRQAAASGAESCAVCLLFSFLNPAHERIIGTAIARALPQMAVSLSSQVQPEFREYERLSTTVLNAYLQPVVGRYVGDLETRLAAVAPEAKLGIFQSSGGLMSGETARRFPVRTALSGPAAGAVGAAHVARSAGRADVITLDMGGTSADVALIRGYETGIAFDRDVAGFPVRLPMVDINTIGAGGGSVAWFDRDELMKVGPASAGAVPGPACYGHGGSEPTVTDANLVLGRLSPKGLLGGRMALDLEAARRVLAGPAERLGFTVERTALGVIGIVVANMVRAIRAVSVERGHDPRKYALLAFGGAGALHAGAVARSLSMPEIIVPPAPGILCAEGLVVAELKEDFVASGRTLLDDGAARLLETQLRGLVERAGAWFAAERIPEAARRWRIALDMRYVGQNFELLVPVGETNALPPPERLRALFHEAHEQGYGYASGSDPVEVVNLRVTAAASSDAPRLAVPEKGGGAKSGARAVWFVADGPVETPVWDRASLAPGATLDGPAVIEQLDATTLVHPGDRVTVDAAGNLIITVGA